MSVPITYQDTVTLVIPARDEWGKETIGSQADVVAAVQQAIGYAHSGNQDLETSDATAYIDPEDSFVQANAYRLEGALLRAQLFGAPAAASWFRVANVSVGRDSLLGNEVNNVFLRLKKTTGPSDGS